MSTNFFRQHLDDYIFCPYKYAKNILSSKYTNNKLEGHYLKFSNYIDSIASYEMQNNTKMDLSEYRVGYTNKFFSNKKDLFDKDFSHIIVKLNNLFSLFSENIFLGYNVPIEIVIPGTSCIFKEQIKYLMIDQENKEIYVIGIMDLSNIEYTKKQFREWPHYYTPYSYIAHKFNKKVNLIIIDPVLETKLELVFLNSRYEYDIKALGDLISVLDKNALYKNLYQCNKCDFISECGG